MKDNRVINSDIKPNSDKNTKTKNIWSFSFVIITQILMFGAGVLASFLLPKFFSVSDYGYIKTYTLYFVYLGLAHFGFIDGLHILLSNKKYNELDTKKIRVYSLVFTIFEFSLTSIAAIIALIVFKGANQTVFLFVALSIFAYNFSGYGQQLAIATSRFKFVSISNLADSIFRMATILLIWVLFQFTYVPYYLYFILYIAQYLVTGAIYCFASRDCFFGQNNIKETSYKEFFYIVKVGFPLLIANLLVSLVSSFTSIFIQIAYPVSQSDAYSIYSFAVSMTSIVTPIITAVGMLFFPSIRKMEEGKAIQYFKKMYVIFSVLIGVALLAYPILINVFNIIVPKYAVAFPYYKIMFPSILTNSIIVCVNLNYFKFVKRINAFNIISALSIVFMSAVSFPLYFAFLKYKYFEVALLAFSIINLVGHVLWLCFTSIYLQKHLKIYVWKEMAFVGLSFSLFFLVSLISTLSMVGFMFFYGVAYIGLAFIFYHRNIKHIFSIAKERVLHLYSKIKK